MSELTYSDVIQGGEKRYTPGVMWTNGKNLKEIAGVTDEYSMFDSNENEVLDDVVYEVSESGIFPMGEK